MKNIQAIIFIILPSIFLAFFQVNIQAQTYEAVQESQDPEAQFKKKKREIKLYFILPKDKLTFERPGTELSCEDRLVSIPAKIETYPNFVLIKTLSALFAMPNEKLAKLEDQEFLNNPLIRSRLKVQSVKIKDYQTHIYLSGKINYKDKCERESIKQQILNTAYQFDPMPVILLNGKKENFDCLGLSTLNCKTQNQTVIDLDKSTELQDSTIIDYK